MMSGNPIIERDWCWMGADAACLYPGAFVRRKGSEGKTAAAGSWEKLPGMSGTERQMWPGNEVDRRKAVADLKHNTLCKIKKTLTATFHTNLQ